MRLFRWLSAGPVPAAFDLRRLGWRLIEGDLPGGQGRGLGVADLAVLVQPDGLVMAQWLQLAGADPAERKRTMLVGVEESQERSRFIRLGFGDAVGWWSLPHELESRAIRVIEQARALPRYRQIGALRLDLLAREAFVAGRPAGLHPREFALLWRLADAPGKAVAPATLLGDVWRLSFRPETNSLAVHVSRLRAKLRLSGVDGLIETLPDGAYRLAVADPPPTGAAQQLPLDAHVRLGEDRSENRFQTDQQDDQHAF